MNRRGFLGLLAAAAAAPLVPVPELDVGRVHFLPPPGGWVPNRIRPSGNRLLTVEEITREAHRILHEEMLFVRNVSRQYDLAFVQMSDDGGRTFRDINIELPRRYA